MNASRIRSVTRRLSAARPSEAAVTDAALLARFLDEHDESALEALVTRHWPAVRAVCRSVLRDPHDADDAAQATFLILVRRAAAVRDREALGAWLGRVAWRTANRLRGENIRRAGRREPGVEPDATPGREPATSCSHTATVVNEEIRLLPERYRLAVLACYVGGTPTADAARNLGWPKGTLLTRLAWARRRLRDRLTKRGITLAAGLATVASERAGIATVVGAVVRMAVAVAAGDTIGKELVSERISSLMEGVVRTMIGTKLKVVAGLAFVAVAVLGLGVGRMMVPTADAADQSGKKKGQAVPVDPLVQAPPVGVGQPPLVGAAVAVPFGQPVGPLVPAVEALPAGPGEDLIVRRPLGSFTKEVAPFGKATLTFTENRIRLHATVNIEKFTVTATADADYSMNRESTVYGVITGVDIITPTAGEVAAGLAPFASVAQDLPFAFRVRVEDDSITIKDLKIGPFGSPLLAEAFGKGGNDAKEMMMMTAYVCGKYKAETNPDRATKKPKK